MPDAPVLLAGRYRLGSSLGRGGMGRVWLASDEILQRDVAIKEILLPDDLDEADRETAQRRTLREARAAARLSHPGVVQIYDVLEVEGRTWIVMEHVKSRSLQEVMRDDGPLEPRRVARIGLDLLAALKAAHAAGVDHRDVKPANVLLADDGRVMLTDFGIATIEGDTLASSSDVLIGSPEYMSPERAKHGTAGLASDLWSLGATLYASVEGRSPFHRGSAVATLTALAADEPDPPRQAGALEPVLTGLLRKDPEERLGAAEAEDLLRSVTTGTYGRAPVTVPIPSPAEVRPEPAAPADPVRRKRLTLAAVAAVLAVVLAAGAVWLLNRDSSGAERTAAPEPTSSAGAGGGPAAPGNSPAARPSSAPASAAPSSSAPAAPPRSSAAAPSTESAAVRLPQLPAGWRDYRDRTGFQLYVPAGWNRTQEGRMVYFRGDGRVLGIDQSDKPKSDPVADWRGQRDARRADGDFPGYREIKIAPVDYFEKAADWEFTFTRNGVRQHVNNRGLVVSDDQAYGIYWQTRDSAWSSARDELDLIFASFRPASD